MVEFGRDSEWVKAVPQRSGTLFLVSWLQNTVCTNGRRNGAQSQTRSKQLESIDVSCERFLDLYESLAVLLELKITTFLDFAVNSTVVKTKAVAVTARRLTPAGWGTATFRGPREVVSVLFGEAPNNAKASAMTLSSSPRNGLVLHRPSHSRFKQRITAVFKSCPNTFFHASCMSLSTLKKNDIRGGQRACGRNMRNLASDVHVFRSISILQNRPFRCKRGCPTHNIYT